MLIVAFQILIELLALVSFAICVLCIVLSFGFASMLKEHRDKLEQVSPGFWKRNGFICYEEPVRFTRFFFLFQLSRLVLILALVFLSLGFMCFHKPQLVFSNTSEINFYLKAFQITGMAILFTLLSIFLNLRYCSFIHKDIIYGGKAARKWFESMKEKQK